MTDDPQYAYALVNIATDRCLCADQGGAEYLICFTEREDVEEFRSQLGVAEYCDIVHLPLTSYPFERFYIDEEFVNAASMTPLDRAGGH